MVALSPLFSFSSKVFSIIFSVFGFGGCLSWREEERESERERERERDRRAHKVHWQLAAGWMERERERERGENGRKMTGRGKGQ